MIDQCERDRRLVACWDILKAKRVSGYAKVVVMDIIQHADPETGKARRSVREIAKAVAMDKETVAKNLAAAEQAGTIERMEMGRLNERESTYRLTGDLLACCTARPYSEGVPAVRTVRTKKKESENPLESERTLRESESASPPIEEGIVLGENPPPAGKKKNPPPSSPKSPPRPLEKDGSWKSNDGLKTVSAEEIDDLLENCLVTETGLRRRLEGALDVPTREHPKHGWARDPKYGERGIEVFASMLRNETAKALARPVTPEQATKLQEDRPWRDMREGPAQDQAIIRAFPDAGYVPTHSDGRLRYCGPHPWDIQQAMNECPHRAAMIARQREQDEARERFRQYQERQCGRQAAREQAASARG